MAITSSNQQEISVNGRAYVLRAGVRADELKRIAQIEDGRQMLAQRPDGSLELVYDDSPITTERLIDVPAFIWG